MDRQTGGRQVLKAEQMLHLENADQMQVYLVGQCFWAYTDLI